MAVNTMFLLMSLNHAQAAKPIKPTVQIIPSKFPAITNTLLLFAANSAAGAGAAEINNIPAAKTMVARISITLVCGSCVDFVDRNVLTGFANAISDVVGERTDKLFPCICLAVTGIDRA